MWLNFLPDKTALNEIQILLMPLRFRPTTGLRYLWRPGFYFALQVWNSVGFIIQYNSEEEQSINVEFHDTATHHSIHVNNTLGHSLADVSSSAALIACEGDENTPRLLTVQQKNSIENSWMISAFSLNTIRWFVVDVVGFCGVAKIWTSMCKLG
jgi:hypothetical protein